MQKETTNTPLNDLSKQELIDRLVEAESMFEQLEKQNQIYYDAYVYRSAEVEFMEVALLAAVPSPRQIEQINTRRRKYCRRQFKMLSHDSVDFPKLPDMPNYEQPAPIVHGMA